MNEKIRQPVALLVATTLVEELIALKYDERYAFIHRENIEQAMIDLGKELGFHVAPVGQLEAAE